MAIGRGAMAGGRFAGRIALVGAVAGALSGAALALLPAVPAWLRPATDARDAGAARTEAPPPAPVESPAVSDTPAAADAPPSFDIARVGQRGMLVAAGRAAPGAEVTLIGDGGEELGRARADRRGEWVILPAHPLRPGPRELVLLARSPGRDSVPGRESVLLLVPAAARGVPVRGREDQVWSDGGGRAGWSAGGGGRVAAGQGGTTDGLRGPLAILLPPAPGRGDSAAPAPRVLQAQPGDTTAGDASAPRPPRAGLALEVVDYTDLGQMRFAGSAAPGSTVRLYVGAAHLGDAPVDATGRWQATPATQPPIGRHRLRLDQIAPDGAVAARIEVPFERERLTWQALAAGGGRVVVQPGESLWRIARDAYGEGLRYTVIYEANRGQIRDPDLIYPGQVFALPSAPSAPAAGAVAPTASSRSR